MSESHAKPNNKFLFLKIFSTWFLVIFIAFAILFFSSSKNNNSAFSLIASSAVLALLFSLLFSFVQKIIFDIKNKKDNRVLPKDQRIYYWLVLIVASVLGSQAYSWFDNIFLAIAVQILSVGFGIFSIKKIWFLRKK